MPSRSQVVMATERLSTVARIRWLVTRAASSARRETRWRDIYSRARRSERYVHTTLPSHLFEALPCNQLNIGDALLEHHLGFGPSELVFLFFSSFPLPRKERNICHAETASSLERDPTQLRHSTAILQPNEAAKTREGFANGLTGSQRGSLSLDAVLRALFYGGKCRLGAGSIL